MGLAGVRVTFPGAVPRLREVCEAAERRGGLPIHVAEGDGQSLVASFASFPEGRVTLSSHSESCVALFDYSLKAPVLYQLLCETLVEFGGQGPSLKEAPLQLPLTEQAVRHALRRVYYRSTLAASILVCLAAAAVGLVVVVWRGMGNAG